jgi:hypothetical protein
MNLRAERIEPCPFGSGPPGEGERWTGWLGPSRPGFRDPSFAIARLRLLLGQHGTYATKCSVHGNSELVPLSRSKEDTGACPLRGEHTYPQ